MKKIILMYLGIGGGVFILIIVGLYFLGRSDIGTSQSGETSGLKAGVSDSKQVEAPQILNDQSPATVAVLPMETFVYGLGSWYEEVWYKSQSSGGEVITGPDGLTFRGIQSNSRSGIMLDLNRDVAEFKNLNLSAKVTAETQTLSGTGWGGREAPVAIAVSYQDVSGMDHKNLAEDPNAAGQMFWRGFYYMDPDDGKAGTTNGVKVTQGAAYNFNFDLMSLSPKPKKIYYIALEGAGWKERIGRVDSVSLTGVK